MGGREGVSKTWGKKAAKSFIINSFLNCLIAVMSINQYLTFMVSKSTERSVDVSNWISTGSPV